jgi:hypothetical protein
MRIERKHIQRATDERRDRWAISDGLLYGLCRKHPNHREASGVTAKMLLIGRTYAATAERGRSRGSAASSSHDTFYTRDIPRELRASRLDRRMDAIRSLRRVTSENVGAIIEVHATLMAVLEDLTGVGKRSLSSKYLHFHLPNLFFIFDERAQRTLRHVEHTFHSRSEVRAVGGDVAYARFVLSALALREQLEERFSVRLTPRHLDRILLELDASAGK